MKVPCDITRQFFSSRTSHNILEILKSNQSKSSHEHWHRLSRHPSSQSHLRDNEDSFLVVLKDSCATKSISITIILNDNVDFKGSKTFVLFLCVFFPSTGRHNVI